MELKRQILRLGGPRARGERVASTRLTLHKTISFLLLASCLASLTLAQTAQPKPSTTSSEATPTQQTSTTLASASSETTSTAQPEATTTTPTTLASDESEPTTTIGDAIGVESDDSDRSTPAVDAEETASGDEPASGAIEPKSISHAAGDNSMDESAKLTVDDSPPAESARDNDDANEFMSSERPRKFNVSSGTPVRLNMSQIDELYATGVKDEAATVRTWRELQKKLKRGIGSVIGAIVPMALNMSQEAKISSNCSGAMLKWVLSMNQLKAWSLRMLDASGKPIAGLLEGSMTMFGNYRQCLKVRAPDDDEIEFAGEFREYFRGKYCIIQLKPWLPQKDRFYNLNTKLASLMAESEDNEWYDRTIFEELSEWLLAFNFVNLRYDLCVPSLCSREDIQKSVNYLLKGLDMKARVARCETDLPDGKLGVAAQVETGAPEVYEALAAAAVASTMMSSNSSLVQQLDLKSFTQLGWLLLPLVAVVLVSLATLLALTIGESEDREQGDDDDGSKRGKLRRTIKSLSLKRSVSSHLNVDYEQLADDKPLALYGLRFALVLWVILVESAVNLKFEYLRELMMLKDLIFWWPMQFIINSTMQYDSFILLTAFTMAYKNCLNDGLRNAKALTRFVVDKYVRLMPSIMVMVAMVILLPLAYRGPVWNDYVTKQSAVCQSTGWLNMVFLQNYLPYSQICLPQTWLLCVELQLVLIMAPLVYYLDKSYTSNFGGRRSSVDSAASQVKKQQQQQANGKASNESAATDSSRPFHWLWTTPGAILFGCIALGLASSFYNVYYRELPPSWFYTMADPDSKALYFGEHMTKLWTHLAVFAMGILAGVECRRASRRLYQQHQHQQHQRSLASGYRNSNIDLMAAAHANQLVAGAHKSHSSSASSLPTINGSNASQQLDSRADTWTSQQQQQQQRHQVNGSSVSIHMGAPGRRLASSTAGSEIGCLHSVASSEGVASQSRGCCAMLLDLLGFALAITIMGAVIFSTHEWSLNELPRPLVAGLFDAASRFLWSLAMIWILYKVSVPTGCSGGNSQFSLLARLLGHPLMVSLGKLSFLIYIIHPFVHTTVLAIQEQPIYSSWLMMFHILIGNITITVILAALVSLFVEMPCRNLFRRCGTSLLLTQSVESSELNCGPTAAVAAATGSSQGRFQ